MVEFLLVVMNQFRFSETLLSTGARGRKMCHVSSPDAWDIYLALVLHVDMML